MNTISGRFVISVEKYIEFSFGVTFNKKKISVIFKTKLYNNEYLHYIIICMYFHTVTPLFPNGIADTRRYTSSST